MGFFRSIIYLGLAVSVLCASASSAMANAMTCVKPFTIANVSSGFNEGDEVTLKAGSPTAAIAPSFYFAWKIPGTSGAADYRSNIGNCNTAVVQLGQLLDPESGNMVGPTTQGGTDLISMDPEASYDTERKCVVSDIHPSPRVITIPLFDGVYYEAGRQNGGNAFLRVDGFLTAFVSGVVNNSIIAVATRGARCSPPLEVCTDATDNDGDGAIDCQDTDCSNDPACIR